MKNATFFKKLVTFWFSFFHSFILFASISILGMIFLEHPFTGGSCQKRFFGKGGVYKCFLIKTHPLLIDFEVQSFILFSCRWFKFGFHFILFQFDTSLYVSFRALLEDHPQKPQESHNFITWQNQWTSLSKHMTTNRIFELERCIEFIILWKVVFAWPTNKLGEGILFKSRVILSYWSVFFTGDLIRRENLGVILDRHLSRLAFSATTTGLVK